MVASGLRRGPHDQGAVRVGAALFAYRQDAPSPTCDYHKAITFTGDALGNDTIGDCLPAWKLQAARLRMANAWGSRWAPTMDQAIRLYSLMTGYDPVTGANDNGTFPAQAQAYLYRTGMDLGLQSIEVVVPAAVDHTDQDAIRWAIETYISADMQLAMPAAWRALGRNAGGVWDIPPGGLDSAEGRPGSWTDHAVGSGRYDGQYFYVISWGGEIALTLRAASAYLIGASCGLARSSISAITGKTPGGLTFDQAFQLAQAA